MRRDEHRLRWLMSNRKVGITGNRSDVRESALRIHDYAIAMGRLRYEDANAKLER
jgi:hypothetical protein